MTPEISRRCPACGAAVRAGAQFCHQCGEGVEKSGAEVSRAEAGGTEQVGASRPAGDDAAAPGPEILKEHWQRWEQSVHARAESSDGHEENPLRSVEASAGHETATASDGVEQQSPHVSSVVPEAATQAHASANIVEGDAAGNEGASGAKRRAAATVVRENLRPRVERMREASIVVMEDAAEDSGMRFVLIAVVLFVLFLLFLFIGSVLR